MAYDHVTVYAKHMYIFITLVLITLTLKVSIFSDIPSFLYFPLHVSAL
jgi:hypothetical protein